MTKLEELEAEYWAANSAYWTANAACWTGDATVAEPVAAWAVVEHAYAEYKAELAKQREMNYETD